jgi:hypothetical protein
MKVPLMSSALALSAFLFAVPVTAHHNSPVQAFVEDKIPEHALDRHNEAVADVLEMGVAEMAGASEAGTMGGEEMDPAEEADGNTCTEILLEDGECGPGNEDMDGPGMDRGIPVADD